MSEMVERVARAICAVTNIAMMGVTEIVLDNPDYIIPAHKTTDKIPVARWTLYVDQARAAIAAMREPTDDMLARGEIHNGLIRGWRAMIDHALKSDAPLA